jgi:hypothetical protein
VFGLVANVAKIPEPIIGLAVTAGVIGIVRHRQRHRDSGSTDTKV